MQERPTHIPERQSSRIEMGFVGDPTVISNILLKRDLLQKGDTSHGDLKTLVIFPGGAQRGVMQGGVSIAFQELGITEAFDTMMGISAGAAAPYYTLAGEAKKGTEIYYKENVANRFINFTRPRKIMDIQVLENVFRLKKPIDFERFLASRPRFLVGLTNAHTGEGKFFDVKNYEDPLSLILASMAVPGFSGDKRVTIDEETYFDGDVGNTLGISYALSEPQPTDILVVMSMPLTRKKHNTLMAFGLEKTFYRKLSSMVKRKFADYEQRYNEELQLLTGEKGVSNGIRIATIFPRHMPIRTTTMDPVLLKQGADAAEKFTMELFGRFNS